MADVRLAHHRNKQAPRPGQGGTSRNPPPHETPPADRQDRSAASSDRRHRKTLADLAWNRLRFVQNDGIRNEPNWRVVRSVQLTMSKVTSHPPLSDRVNHWGSPCGQAWPIGNGFLLPGGLRWRHSAARTKMERPRA